jgi:hypothetical protein
MPHTPNASAESADPTVYRIRIKGHLGARWNDWFEHMTITPEANGETVLTGPLADQAALHGVLTNVRDLGLPLISIERVAPSRNPHHRKDTT